MADNSYFQSPSVDYGSFYTGSMAPPVSSGGMLRPSLLSSPTIASNRPTPAQLAAMQAVPAGSYQTPPNRPILAPNIPSGSQYQDTGNLGRATPEMQQLIQLAGSGGIRPGWTTPQVPPPPNVPLPRPRPGYAPTLLDMAAINGQAGASGAPRAPGGGNPMIGGIGPFRGVTGQVPGAPRQLTAAESYSLANLAGKQAALQRQAAGRAAGLMTPVEQLRAQGLSPSAAYNAANSGPGSVSAMEAWHSGGSSNPQSGGPAVGGDYGGGGNNESSGGPPKWVLYGSKGGGAGGSYRGI